MTPTLAELIVPAPARVKPPPLPVPIAYEAAVLVKLSELTVMAASSVTNWEVVPPKMVSAAAPLGMPLGLQFAATFHEPPVVGCQVLWAMAVSDAMRPSRAATRPAPAWESRIMAKSRAGKRVRQKNTCNSVRLRSASSPGYLGCP